MSNAIGNSVLANKKSLVVGAVVIALSAVGYLVYESLVFVSSDNATIQAHTLLLAARVGGVIDAVEVDENQKVKKGEVLARVDQREYTAAQLQADAELGGVQARLKDAEVNFRRAESLIASNAISKQQFDAAEASFRELKKKAAAVKARLDEANLNLAYTEIRAPADGVVAKRSVEAGQVVSVGQPLFGFVESTSRWVIANLKETELRGVKRGRPATVTVDALSNKKFFGEVESISPATGATFSLLPPDNATGNFTKVVQRVPVRIRLLNLTPEDIDSLQAGLSAEVKVKVR